MWTLYWLQATPISSPIARGKGESAGMVNETSRTYRAVQSKKQSKKRSERIRRNAIRNIQYKPMQTAIIMY